MDNSVMVLAPKLGPMVGNIAVIGVITEPMGKEQCGIRIETSTLESGQTTKHTVMEFT